MPVQPADIIIRPSRESDASQWAELYRGYREFYRLAPDDAVVERVWKWVCDPGHEVNSLVAAVEPSGELVGLANFRRFSRPSTGTVGLYLDDLFSAPAQRGRGVGRRLLGALSELAASQGLSVVRWITAANNERARRLYDQTATATQWVTYDLRPGSVTGGRGDARSGSI